MQANVVSKHALCLRPRAVQHNHGSTVVRAHWCPRHLRQIGGCKRKGRNAAYTSLRKRAVAPTVSSWIEQQTVRTLESLVEVVVSVKTMPPGYIPSPSGVHTDSLALSKALATDDNAPVSRHTLQQQWHSSKTTILLEGETGYCDRQVAKVQPSLHVETSS